MNVGDSVKVILTQILLLFTLPIYFLFLLTLFKFRKDEELSSAFFRMIFINGVADIFQIIDILVVSIADFGLIPGPFIWMGDLSSKILFLG